MGPPAVLIVPLIHILLLGTASAFSARKYAAALRTGVHTSGAHAAASASTRHLLQSSLLDCDVTSYNAFLSPRSTEVWSVSNAGQPVFKSCYDVSFDGLQLVDVYVNVATKQEQRVPYLYKGTLSFGSTDATCAAAPTDGAAALQVWANFIPTGNLTQYMAAGLPSRPSLPFPLGAICHDNSTQCASQGAATVCAAGSPVSCPVTCGQACPAGSQWKLVRTELGAVASAAVTTCCDATTACTAYTSEVEWVSNATSSAGVEPPSTAPPPTTAAPAPLNCAVTSYAAFLSPSSTQTTGVAFADTNSSFQSCVGMNFRVQLVDVYSSTTGEQQMASYWYNGTLTTGDLTNTCANSSAASDLLQQYTGLLTADGGLDVTLATSLFGHRPSLPFPADTICADAVPQCRTGTQDEVCANGSALASVCPVTCGTCNQTWQLTNTLLGQVDTLNITTCCDTTDACTKYISEVDWQPDGPPAPPLPPFPPPLALPPFPPPPPFPPGVAANSPSAGDSPPATISVSSPAAGQPPVAAGPGTSPSTPGSSPAGPGTSSGAVSPASPGAAIITGPPAPNGVGSTPPAPPSPSSTPSSATTHASPGLSLQCMHLVGVVVSLYISAWLRA